MHHSFSVLVLNILPTCFGILECHHQGVRFEPTEMVPIVVGSREGWEVCIVTADVMVGISRPLRRLSKSVCASFVPRSLFR
jgi:hypothetical protein